VEETPVKEQAPQHHSTSGPRLMTVVGAAMMLAASALYGLVLLHNLQLIQAIGFAVLIVAVAAYGDIAEWLVGWCQRRRGPPTEDRGSAPG